MTTTNAVPDFDALLAALRGDSPAERLAALQTLAAWPDGLARALPLLGPLALHDPDPAVRQAARDLLAAGAAATRFLSWPVRGEILRQLDQWQIGGRLSAEQADLLRARYNFDLRPTPPSPEARRALAVQIENWLAQGLVSAEQANALRGSLEPQTGAVRAAAAQKAATVGAPAAVGAPTAAAPAQAAQVSPAAGMPAPSASAGTAGPAAAPAGAPAGPVTRQSVLQTLFSELTIRIALYLGGFLIVSASLILAAILEVARLPILLGLTASAGLAAGLTRKRLPLPSFVLFAIFASLLPIDGRIYVDLFFPPGQPTTGFWALIWLVTAGVLALGTLLYRSRLYSLLALAALEGSAGMFAYWRHGQWELYALLSALTALVGLLGAVGLKRRKDAAPDPRPLFWAAQLVALLTFGMILLVDFVNVFEGVQAADRWLLQALAWLVGIAFYLLADLAFLSFDLFPFLAAGALLCFAPALYAAIPGLAGRALAAALAGAGLLYTAAADGLQLGFAPKTRFRRYALPVFLAALVLLTWAAGVGLDFDTPTGLVILLAVALVYAGLHLQRRRPWLWLAALLFGLGAYVAFFDLPLAKSWQLDSAYQLLIAGLLYALPDLLRGPDHAAGRRWTVLARWLGAALLGLTVLVTWARLDSGSVSWPVGARMWEIGAVISALTGLVCLGYALRFRRAWLGWGFTALTTLAFLCLLEQARLPFRALPVLVLALIFWLAGLALRQLSAEQPGGPAAERDGEQTADRAGGLAGRPAGELSAPRAGKLPGAPWNWSLVLRSSGLALAALLVFQLPVEHGAGPGLALLAAGGLALLELWLTGFGPLEFLAEGLLAGGAVRLVSLLAWPLPQPGTGLLAAALVVLSLDLALTRFGARFPVFRWGVGSPTAADRSAVEPSAAGERVESGSPAAPDAANTAAATVTSAAADTSATPDKSGAPAAPAADRPTRATAGVPAAPAGWWTFGPASFFSRWAARALGGTLAALAVLALLIGATGPGDFAPGLPRVGVAAAEFVLLGAFLLIAALRIYRQPLLGFAPSALLALALFYGLRWAGQTQWLAPEVTLAVVYYAAAALLRAGRPGWISVLRYSGLALAMLAGLAGWTFMDGQGKLFASLPVAAAATLYAVEAFRRRNVWLGFPANLLYLLAYFILLIQLKVDQPQYYSVGVAVLGMLMHYLLLRTGNGLAAFLTGMVSQFVLLGTTYIQMYSTHQLSYFVMLFFEGLLVLAYGIAIRSRSLVFTPLGFIVIGVITVVLTVLSGVPTAIIIGCTGVALLTGGILAVLLRERLLAASDKIGERLGGWRA